MHSRRTLLGICILAVACGCRPAAESPAPVVEKDAPAPKPAAPLEPTARLRRPVALAFVDDGTRLLVANGRSGSVSEIDTTDNTLLAENDVADGLADLVPVPGSDVVLLADNAANEVMAVRRNGTQLDTLCRLKVAASPRAISISPDRTTAYVSCDWAQRLFVLDIRTPEQMKVVTTIDMPFSPGLHQNLPDGKHLVVTDAFGGEVAVVDLKRNELGHAQRWTAAHNLRGLAMTNDQKKLLVPHQILMSEYATTPNGVHWGQVLMNVLRVEAVDSLFTDKHVWGGKTIYLGDENNATGDPTSVVVTKDGRRIVSFAGTAEVAISDEGGEEFARVDVGLRPTALALSLDHSSVYVTNTFSDSISVVDVNTATAAAEISLGPQAELTAVDRGELLFHDANLSRDRWFSCHSCHTDGHSNGLLNDNFADGSAGSAKRVLSLLGVASTHPWAWNGKRTDLAEQVRASVNTTMRGEEPTEEQVEHLVAYLESLEPPPSLAEARGECDEKAVARGAVVFENSGCVNCHPSPNYTAGEAFDVGIHDPLGNVEFNPPSLLGVSQRDRLFHDNRAEGLLDVFKSHQHGLDDPLPSDDIQALVAFLETL